MTSRTALDVKSFLASSSLDKFINSSKNWSRPRRQLRRIECSLRKLGECIVALQEGKQNISDISFHVPSEKGQNSSKEYDCMRRVLWVCWRGSPVGETGVSSLRRFYLNGGSTEPGIIDRASMPQQPLHLAMHRRIRSIPVGLHFHFLVFFHLAITIHQHVPVFVHHSHLAGTSLELLYSVMQKGTNFYLNTRNFIYPDPLGIQSYGQVSPAQLMNLKETTCPGPSNRRYAFIRRHH